MNTSKPGTPVIDLMIVGAQKAATTSALAYFRRLPDVAVPIFDEFGFFTNEREWAMGYAHAYRLYFGRKQAGVIVAKHANMLSVPVALERLRGHNAKVQVLTLLRDPVTRAYSAYLWARREGIEPLSDAEAAIFSNPRRFKDPSMAQACDYLGNGDYAPRIIAMQELFGVDNVHVVFDTDFLRSPNTALGEVASRLAIRSPLPSDVPRMNAAGRPRSLVLAGAIMNPRVASMVRPLLPQRFSRRARVAMTRWNSTTSATPPQMSPALAARLRAHYQPADEQLSNLLGQSLPWRDTGDEH